MTFKAAIFDLDDTLYDYQQLHQGAMMALCQHTCSVVGISPDQFWKYNAAAKKNTKATLQNTAASHNRMLYFQNMLEQAAYRPITAALDMYEVYWGYLIGHLQLRPGVLELLEKLKSNGIEIGICTDLTAHIQHRKIKKAGLGDYIDVLVTSEEAGVEKPNIKIFQLCLHKMDKHPHECVFVGDSLNKDILGASAAGMQTVLFDNDSKFDRYDGAKAGTMEQLSHLLFE